MTTPSGPSTPSAPGHSLAVPVRSLTAWALLALAAAVIAFAFLSWIFPSESASFLDRFRVGTFTDVKVLVGPLLAMLIATKLGPPLPRSRQLGLVAVAEYAAALALGLLAFLLTLAARFDGLESGIFAFGGVIDRLGGIVVDVLLLALLALAGLWTYGIFTGLGGRLPQVNIRTS